MGIETYIREVSAGRKWCIRCRIFHAVEEFGIDRYARDGRTPMCKSSWRVKVKNYHRTRGTTGLKLSAATRAKMSIAHRGERNHLWKGGITLATRQARKQAVYQEWRRAVMRRDGMACVRCGTTTNLHAHHVKPYRQHPELATDVSNGITLCADHHRKIHQEQRHGR